MPKFRHFCPTLLMLTMLALGEASADVRGIIPNPLQAPPKRDAGQMPPGAPPDPATPTPGGQSVPIQLPSPMAVAEHAVGRTGQAAERTNQDATTALAAYRVVAIVGRHAVLRPLSAITGASGSASGASGNSSPMPGSGPGMPSPTNPWPATSQSGQAAPAPSSAVLGRALYLEHGKPVQFLGQTLWPSVQADQVELAMVTASKSASRQVIWSGRVESTAALPYVPTKLESADSNYSTRISASSRAGSSSGTSTGNGTANTTTTTPGGPK